MTWAKRADSSPLRAKSFELLEREVTIRAVISLRAELVKLREEGQKGSIEGLAFFDEHVKPWLPMLMVGECEGGRAPLTRAPGFRHLQPAGRLRNTSRLIRSSVNRVATIWPTLCWKR